MSRPTLSWLLPLLCLQTSAAAQSYRVVLEPASQIELTSDVSLALPGTLIGNHDPVTNPTGTQTRPGLVGGSGNQPVDTDITVLVDFAFQGSPSGAFDLELEVGAHTPSVDGLALDLLGAAPGQGGLTLELLFETFRTFDPDSVYLGGFPLPLPLGNIEVTDVVLAQTGGASGALVPDPMLPDTYAWLVAVPAEVSFTVSVLGGTTPVGPVPLVLPLGGTLVKSGAAVQIAAAAQQTLQQTIPDPLPGQAIEDLPLDLPTILPPGQTAHLLFNAVFGELGIDFALDLALAGSGLASCEVAPYCEFAPNSAGKGAALGIAGTVSVSSNDLVLVARRLPPGRSGSFVFGDLSRNVPFGNGTLCVGGTLHQLGPVRPDALGNASYRVDFASPVPPVDLLQPGTTWYFQYTYRDPAGRGAKYNASTALAIQFCP
jgi:hypothetical protein